jgi:uncharacterized damage-inducible protein DinB
MNADQAKATADMLAAVWEGEFPATCQVLTAASGGNPDYRPDAKSRTARELATHLATADIWFLECIVSGAFQFDPERAKKAEAQFNGLGDVIEFYKKAFPEKLGAVRALPAEKMTDVIDFFGVYQWPRARWIGFANNHSIHHRGQLAAYLRAMGSKVPNIYGPSADAEK